MQRPKRRTGYSKRPRYYDFMAWVKSMPCAVCGRVPCDPAHVGERGMNQKCDDMETIPLCKEHHRREYPESVHGPLGKRFWEYHGIDREALIARLQHCWQLIKGEQGGQDENGNG